MASPPDTLREAFTKLEAELALATEPAANETANLLEIYIRQAAEKLRHGREQG